LLLLNSEAAVVLGVKLVTTVRLGLIIGCKSLILLFPLVGCLTIPYHS
jgi:hypothetical protein